jgi:replicative DNA helicase
MRFPVRYIDRTFGAIAENDFVIFGAPTGFGKSTLATELVEGFIQQGIKPAFFNYENSQRDTLLRRAFVNWRLETRDFRTLYRDWRQEWESGKYDQWLAEADEYLTGMFLVENRGEPPSLATLSADLEDAKNAGCQILILDHLDVIACDKVDIFNHTNAVLKTVNNFVQQNKIPVIAFSQLGTIKDKQVIVPSIETLFGSREKGKIATAVIMITRDFLNDQKEENRFATLFVYRKDRYGKAGIGARLFWNSETAKYDSDFQNVYCDYYGLKLKEKGFDL